MARAVLFWLGASALGIALMALLPDDWLGGEMLFRLSDRHGPTLADATGLALILAGWGTFLQALWSRRRDLEQYWAAWLLAVVAIAALCGCLAAFAANLDGWGAALGFVALTAQLSLARMAHRSQH